MHLLILFIFLRLAAIIVWVADWTTVGNRRATAVDILNRVLPAARSTEPSMRRSVSCSVANASLAQYWPPKTSRLPGRILPGMPSAS